MKTYEKINIMLHYLYRSVDWMQKETGPTKTENPAKRP